MMELSRAQDEEVGDGTTSVIIVAGQVLAESEPLLLRNMHPTDITTGYFSALQFALDHLGKVSTDVPLDNADEVREMVESVIGTKFIKRFGSLMINLALEAVQTVTVTLQNGRKDVDIKRYAKVEKIPGGEIEDSRVLRGVMFNKDITHSKMRRRIEKPRIMLLDCPLEYKKGESQTNVEISDEAGWETLLKAEDE